MHVFTHVSELLLQVAPHTYPDTIIAKTVPPSPSFLSIVGGIVRVLLWLTLLALAAALVPAAWSLRKIARKVNDLADRLYQDAAPAIRNATVIAEDAREIATSIKGDARTVQQTVAAANTRLLKAVKQTEARIDQFNALLEVVQEEAEATFVTTAATVRGVRTGVGQIFDTNEGEDDGDIDERQTREDGDQRPTRFAGTDPAGPSHAGPARPRVKHRRDNELS